MLLILLLFLVMMIAVIGLVSKYLNKRAALKRESRYLLWRIDPEEAIYYRGWWRDELCTQFEKLPRIAKEVAYLGKDLSDCIKKGYRMIPIISVSGDFEKSLKVFPGLPGVDSTSRVDLVVCDPHNYRIVLVRWRKGDAFESVEDLSESELPPPVLDKYFRLVDSNYLSPGERAFLVNPHDRERYDYSERLFIPESLILGYVRNPDC